MFCFIVIVNKIQIFLHNIFCFLAIMNKIEICLAQYALFSYY